MFDITSDNCTYAGSLLTSSSDESLDITTHNVHS